MEVRLTIFSALTFALMASNAVFMLWLWRMFHRAGERARARRARYIEIREMLQTSVLAAEEATSDLAAVSGQLRSAAHTVDETLGRADNWARYGLAKLDFNADRVSAKLGARTRRLTDDIRDPVFRTATAIHGVKALLDLAVRWRDGKSPHLKQATRIVAPVDTAATLVQAVAALGELFSRRQRNGAGPSGST